MSLATESGDIHGSMSANDSESRPRPRSLGLNLTTPSNPTRPKRGPRQLAHGRSLSHTKISNKPTLSENRPNLLRLKSTDLIKMRNIKRNGRLYTKISGLQPLTKTMLNLLLKKGNSSGSLRNMGPQLVGLKATKKGKAILSLNDDDYDNYEDIDDEKVDVDHDHGNSGGPVSTNLRAKTVSPVASPDYITAGTEPEVVTVNEEDPSTTINGRKVVSERENQEKLGEPKVSILENTTVHSGGNTGSNSEIIAPNRESASRITHTSTKMMDRSHDPSTYEPEIPHKQSQRGLPANMTTIDSLNVMDSNQPTTSSNASNQNRNQNQNQPPDHTSSLSLPSNFFLGSLLLSQLTGVTRNIANIPKIAPQDFALETISGITFQAHPMDAAMQPVAPVTTQKTVETNSYQPSHTIFNNLQRTTGLDGRLGVLMAGIPGLDPNSLRGGLLQDLHGHYDGLDATFHNFLTLNLLSVLLQQESRTQQRLWLQRENSLMDVVGSENAGVVANLLGLSLHTLVGDGNLDLQPQHGQNLPLNRGEMGGNPGIQEAMNQSLVTNGLISAHSMTNLAGFLQNSSIQLKTEFERLNREYLNVRRHLNPVSESVNRARSYLKLGIQLRNPKREEKPTNNFQDFLPQFEGKEPEISALVSRLWQRALLLLQLGNLGRPSGPASGMGTVGAPQSQRPPHTRLQLYTQLQNSMRNSQTPTTRAVKLAQHQYRKNDLPLLNIA